MILLFRLTASLSFEYDTGFSMIINYDIIVIITKMN
jgi:hypothetical protein